MAKKKVLVAGASGLVGFAAIRHFASLDLHAAVTAGFEQSRLTKPRLIIESRRLIVTVSQLFQPSRARKLKSCPRHSLARSASTVKIRS